MNATKDMIEESESVTVTIEQIAALSAARKSTLDVLAALSAHGYVIVKREVLAETAATLKWLAEYAGCSGGAKTIAEEGHRIVSTALTPLNRKGGE